MARTTQVSTRKRSRTTLPALGVAGVSLAVTGGASAAIAPTATVPSQNTIFQPVITLGEEEISDVSLATFLCSTKKTPVQGSPACKPHGDAGVVAAEGVGVGLVEPAAAAVVAAVAAAAVRRGELAASARSGLVPIGLTALGLPNPLGRTG